MASIIEPRSASTERELEPLRLRDAPALIERVFPAQKVSFEAQRERKANVGQTLTSVGSYWKGRKPLILVRAIVLGSLLPQTDDPEQDLAVFEALMGFDIVGLARRAVAKNSLSPARLAAMIELDNPWASFKWAAKPNADVDEAAVPDWTFPLDADALGLRLSWRRDVSDERKADLYAQALATLGTYEERATLGKRPEEVDQEFLLAPAWPIVNEHLGTLGVEAYSMPELVEQLGVLRYGHRPRVGDTFAGGGSIPFEAARMGCDAYASDLNPVACMLNWGNFNIIGASPERRAEIEQSQAEVAAAVDAKITRLGIEHKANGDRAKAFLYCLETRCPETGWLVPMAPSWVVSKTRNVIARLEPDYATKRFNIEIATGVDAGQMEQATQGTVQNGQLVYELDGTIHRTPIKTLRGDYRDDNGDTRNRLRQWELQDFKPRPDDIFQERLYCVQWIHETINERTGKPRTETYFDSVGPDDLEREARIEQIVADNLTAWQAHGLVPDMEIEPGAKTSEPIRTRGWRYWHQLFNARQLLIYASYFSQQTPEDAVSNAKTLDWNSKICNWMTHWEKTNNVFYNQALNTFYNYGLRAFKSHDAGRSFNFSEFPTIESEIEIRNAAASNLVADADIWVTDPPYADAVHYHEITEFFIAWLRKNSPAPFDKWTWDSRRSLAIQGDGAEFRRDMVAAYKAMTKHMPDNGTQCVMFTHKDAGVWSDMVGIFWAAGLQVIGAWYIATETSSELKKGGYVQGTVTLVLRKRASGERVGFPARIYPAVRAEVGRQIDEMLHLNNNIESRTGEPVFNDADLQMAGYAAALKVLTGYTQIGSEDVTAFALRPRRRGEKTVVDDMIEQAAETANGLLVPEGLNKATWESINGVQRFYLRLMAIETTGAKKLDNYENFAKAFRVADYGRLMASTTPNAARLKQAQEFKPRELTDATELGATPLGWLIVAIQERLKDQPIETVMEQLTDMPEYFTQREALADMARFFADKAPEANVRQVADVLADRIGNQRLS